MSENKTTAANLLKLATELIEARAKAAQGEWDRGLTGKSLEINLGGNGVIYDEGGHNGDDAQFIVLAANNACTVITGYQDLVRRMIELVEEMDTYLDAHGLIGHVIETRLAEAYPAIPNNKE